MWEHPLHVEACSRHRPTVLSISLGPYHFSTVWTTSSCRFCLLLPRLYPKPFKATLIFTEQKGGNLTPCRSRSQLTIDGRYINNLIPCLRVSSLRCEFNLFTSFPWDWAPVTLTHLLTSLLGFPPLPCLTALLTSWCLLHLPNKLLTR